MTALWKKLTLSSVPGDLTDPEPGPLKKVKYKMKIKLSVKQVARFLRSYGLQMSCY